MRGGIDRKFFKIFNFGWNFWLFIIVFITYWFYYSYNSEVMDSIVAKDYKLSKKLGSGAFGEVFLAINIKNHAEYAVKL